MNVEFEKDYLCELLKDELEYRQLSQKEVAKQLGLPYTAFNEKFNCNFVVRLT